MDMTGMELSENSAVSADDASVWSIGDFLAQPSPSMIRSLAEYT